MTNEMRELVEAADGLDHVASALQEVHALSGIGDDVAFDASMFGQIAAVERGASRLRKAAHELQSLSERNAVLLEALQTAVWHLRCSASNSDHYYSMATLSRLEEALLPLTPQEGKQS